MALWKILRRDPSSNIEPIRATGEVYDDRGNPGTDDDQPLDIETYLTQRQIEDGWEYSAEPA